MKNFLKSEFSRLAAFTGVFAVAMAYVFWGTWSPEITFIQPDQGVTYPADYLSRMVTRILAGGTFVPGDLRFVLGGAYVWQELQYALAVYLAALGMVYYLKGRSLPSLACYGAGAAYGLSGYGLTLFSAGHLGWFIYLMYGPFAFGLIDRCVRKGKWVNWILLGGVLAWSAAQQPDMWLLFTLLAFVYGVFRTVCVLMVSPSPLRKFLRVFVGVAVVLFVTTLAGWPQLYNAVVVQTANRDKQISQSAASVADNGAKTPAERKKDREKRYVFCTNWSLPPDEVLEFAVPEINGGSSDPRISPKNPYRGRIGVQVSPGRWQPYRQHSLYMGFFTIGFAFVGIAALLFALIRRLPPASPGEADNRREMLFWLIAVAVILFCAFGAFTPFYRLVFALPMGDYIRCPVKFVHLLEWCVAVFAGFGIAALLSSNLARKMPKAVIPSVTALLVVNVANLAVISAGYCAVDPGEVARIAAARETGSNSICFAMDGNAAIDQDVIIAGGNAFRDNAALKTALAAGTYEVVSFRNFSKGRFVKVPRERAAFAVLKAKMPKERDENADRPLTLTSVVSVLVTVAVMGIGMMKLRRRTRV